MRVPNKTLYDASRVRLGGLTTDLNTVNGVLASGKRINNLSDDPIGLTQVLNIKHVQANLEQMERNTVLGKNWLMGGESSLTSFNDQVLEIKTLTSQLINATVGETQRQDAVARIQGTIQQLVDLANTQVGGDFVFGGTRTDKPPFVYNRGTETETVTYEGNDTPFRIKFTEDTTLEIGRNGYETFWEDTLEVNTTNNTIMFMEDTGEGSLSQKIITATIPYGVYDKSSLETLVENVMNEASAEQGYGVVYEVVYNEAEKTYTIRQDGTDDRYVRTTMKWDSAGEAHLKNVGVSSNIDPADVNVVVRNKSALTLATPEPYGSDPMRFTWDAHANAWHVDNNPGYFMTSTLAGTAEYLAIDFSDDGQPDIEIRFQQPLTETGDYIEFDIVPAFGDHSIGSDLGFTGDRVIAPVASDNAAEFITDITIDATNQRIDFEEVNAAGVSTGILTAAIPAATYTDMDVLAAAIEGAIEAESVASGNSIDYTVVYDPEHSRFSIRETGTALNTFCLCWNTGPSGGLGGAGDILGFQPVDDRVTYPVSDTFTAAVISIDSNNNRLEFEEIDGAGVSSGPISVLVPTGEYRNVNDLALAIETEMNAASVNGVTYAVGYDAATRRFTIEDSGPVLNELHLLWRTGPFAEHSIGETLGFTAAADAAAAGVTSYTGDHDTVLMTFDAENNVIDFQEVDRDGITTENLKALIPEGAYTNMADVAAAIETSLRSASAAAGNGVMYAVSYDAVSGLFSIKGNAPEISAFHMRWATGPGFADGAARTLGFDRSSDDAVVFAQSDAPVVSLTVDASNNKLDFKEIIHGETEDIVCELTAAVPAGNYASYDALAAAIEQAMEAESRDNGNQVNYSVTYDPDTRKFSFKETGDTLGAFSLLWETGLNRDTATGGTGEAIGRLLGFDPKDDTWLPSTSSRKAEWGIFQTLIDLKGYLNNDDVDGLERSLGRLDANFAHLSSVISDNGVKYNRLDIQEQIRVEMDLSLTERRSTLEDADYVEAIMELQTTQLAYEASLNASSKLLKMSLMDYM